MVLKQVWFDPLTAVTWCKNHITGVDKVQGGGPIVVRYSMFLDEKIVLFFIWAASASHNVSKAL